MTAICSHCANQSKPQSDNGVENGPRDCNEKTTIIRIGVMAGEHDCFDRASILTWWNTPALFQDRSRQIMGNWFRGSYI